MALLPTSRLHHKSVEKALSTIFSTSFSIGFLTKHHMVIDIEIEYITFGSYKTNRTF